MLSLFTTTLHGLILRALVDGPVRLSNLHAQAGDPTLKALRGNIGNLIGIGALEKRRPGGEPDLLDNELTPFGRDLLLVAEVLDDWLGRAPDGPLGIDSEAAKEAIRALLGGWGSTMLRALAARPFSLAELDELIGSFGNAALDRRLVAMHDAGQVTALSGDSDVAAYAVTDWLREGVAPLLASIRCERLHLEAETAQVARIDIETLLLLAVPLAGPLAAADGTCQLGAAVGDGSRQTFAGVRTAVEDGKIVSCVTTLEPKPDDWAHGSAADLLDVIVEGGPNGLETGGVDRLSSALLDGLHGRLFAFAADRR